MVIRHYDDPLYHDWKCDYPHERNHFVLDNGLPRLFIQNYTIIYMNGAVFLQLTFVELCVRFFLEFHYYI